MDIGSGTKSRTETGIGANTEKRTDIPRLSLTLRTKKKTKTETQPRPGSKPERKTENQKTEKWLFSDVRTQKNRKTIKSRSRSSETGRHENCNKNRKTDMLCLSGIHNGVTKRKTEKNGNRQIPFSEVQNKKRTGKQEESVIQDPKLEKTRKTGSPTNYVPRAPKLVKNGKPKIMFSGSKTKQET